MTSITVMNIKSYSRIAPKILKIFSEKILSEDSFTFKINTPASVSDKDFMAYDIADSMNKRGHSVTIENKLGHYTIRRD